MVGTAAGLGRYRALIEFHIANQTDGFVVISANRRRWLAALQVDRRSGEDRTVACRSSPAPTNSTTEAIELTASAKSRRRCLPAGAPITTNRARRLVPAFKAVAEAVEIPQIFTAGRTVADIANDTALRLAQVLSSGSRTTGNLQRGTDLVCAPQGLRNLQRRRRKLLMGGHGVTQLPPTWRQN